jgi:pimeloyl-ACP methyl ester carboxylesterase
MNDLETVVESAAPERFALLGISQGGAAAAAYAAHHPERVSHRLLYGAYARGWQLRGKPEDTESRQALITLIRLGWGANHTAFRQLWTKPPPKCGTGGTRCSGSPLRRKTQYGFSKSGAGLT